MEEGADAPFFMCVKAVWPRWDDGTTAREDDGTTARGGV